MLSELTDGDLIQQFRDKGNELALKTLIERHYKKTYARFYRELKMNAFDAKECSAELWKRVALNLDKYQDDGRFTHFLSRVSTNLIKEHWRHTGSEKRKQIDESKNLDEIQELPIDVADPEAYALAKEKMQYLVKHAIPDLPIEQRMAWLLRQESEISDSMQPIDWQQLADLNGLDLEQTWKLFESARAKLMGKQPLEPEEQLIFLVWTQANRGLFSQKFTEDYFAQLLGISHSKFRGWYNAARKNLATSLSRFEES